MISMSFRALASEEMNLKLGFVMFHQALRHVGFVVLFGLCLVRTAEAGTAMVLTETGNHAFNVELVDTPADRSKGLMFRREMAAEAGMLFDFKVSEPVHFWMKNTYVSLDMIFIRENGIVARVAENTVPLSTKIVPSREPVRYVLEVVAGTAKRIGLKSGDRVLHSAIDQ